jgi:hypothetical protein
MSAKLLGSQQIHRVCRNLLKEGEYLDDVEREVRAAVHKNHMNGGTGWLWTTTDWSWLNTMIHAFEGILREYREYHAE